MVKFSVPWIIPERTAIPRAETPKARLYTQGYTQSVYSLLRRRKTGTGNTDKKIVSATSKLRSEGGKATCTGIIQAERQGRIKKLKKNGWGAKVLNFQKINGQ